MTTNALGLARTAHALKAAGLDRVNVSLDSVRSETFYAVTRRDRLHDVIEGLIAAREAGLGPIKINAVLLRGHNDDQAAELLRWCLDRGYDLRFIEQMPLDAQHGWSRAEMITADEIFTSLEKEFVLSPAVEPRGSAPAELFLVDGGPATVGVIASVTRPVLWRLRPGAAHRRRSGPQLPVRPRRVRPARGAAGRGDRRGDRRPVGDRDGGQASRARHRRPDLPAARPADVSDRWLTDPGPPVRRLPRRHP